MHNNQFKEEQEDRPPGYVLLWLFSPLNCFKAAYSDSQIEVNCQSFLLLTIPVVQYHGIWAWLHLCPCNTIHTVYLFIYFAICNTMLLLY